MLEANSKQFLALHSPDSRNDRFDHEDLLEHIKEAFAEPYIRRFEALKQKIDHGREEDPKPSQIRTELDELAALYDKLDKATSRYERMISRIYAIQGR